MSTIVRTSYETSKDAIDEVRQRVFVEDQQIPADIVWDDREDVCDHVVAYLSSDSGRRVPVGAARIDLSAGGKIGRVAVIPDRRRTGLGRRLMNELIAIAREAGAPSVYFHAQESAVPFYKALGYSPQGEPFLEAGIPHYEMKRPL